MRATAYSYLNGPRSAEVAITAPDQYVRSRLAFLRDYNTVWELTRKDASVHIIKCVARHASIQTNLRYVEL